MTFCVGCGGVMPAYTPHDCRDLSGVVVPAHGVGPEPLATEAHRALLEAAVAHLRAELARERALRASTGCACRPLDNDLPPSHVAGCPAMDGSRLRSEVEHWRDRAQAMLAAARSTHSAHSLSTDALDLATKVSQARDEDEQTLILVRWRTAARERWQADVLTAVERAYNEPKKEPTK